MSDHVFPRQVRLRAQKLFVNTGLSNGIAVMMTFGQVVYLLALSYGASDVQMSLLYAAIHIGGLFSILSSWLFDGWAPKNVWTLSLVGRTAMIFGYFLLPFLPASLQVHALVLIFYLFMIFRTFGFTTLLPMMNAITVGRERATTMSRMVVNGSYSCLVGMFISYAFMQMGVFESERHNYFALLLIGIIATCIVIPGVYQLPKSSPIKFTGFGGLWGVAKETWSQTTLRKIYCLSFLSTTLQILGGYQLVIYRKLVELSPEMIFLLVFIGLVAGTMMNIILGWMNNFISLWSLLMASHGLIAIASLMLSLCGEYLTVDHWWLYLISCTIFSVGASLSGTIVLRLQSKNLPKDTGLEVNVLFQLFSVMAAFTCMALVALLEGSINFGDGPSMFHEYSPIMWICVLTALSIIILGSGVSGIQEALKDLSYFTPLGLWALHRASKINMMERTPTLVHQMEDVLQYQSSISQKLLSDYLSSTDYLRNIAAYRKLINTPDLDFGAEVLEQLNTPGYLHVENALTYLGMTKKSEYIPTFKAWASHEDVGIQGAAIKGLIRCGASMDEDEFITCYRQSPPKLSRVQFLQPLGEMEQKSLLWRVLEDDLSQQTPEPIVRIVMINIARAYKERDGMIDLMDAAEYDPKVGAQVFTSLTGVSILDLDAWLRNKNYSAISEECHRRYELSYLGLSPATSLGLLYLAYLKSNDHPTDV